MEQLDLLYRTRFPEADREAREKMWQVLCRHFFQKFIGGTDTILELGCGFGEFSRFIRAGKKIAIDANPDAGALLPPEVDFHLGDATDLAFIADSSIDVCFVSNFFEHLPSKSALDRLLGEIRRGLKPGGILIALQPNIKYAPGDYWDFYDHFIPLSHRSCAEAFAKSGLEVVELIGRFLPFTTRSLLPTHPLLVWLYLKVRPAWRILGRQFLIVGRKPMEDGRQL